MKLAWTLIAVVVASSAVFGCNSAEDKELAEERVALLRAQNEVVTKHTDCSALSKALMEFEDAHSAEVKSNNMRWMALPESKRNSLMKAHKEETNAYFSARISPLVRCGTVFPVK